jgi:cytochrome P450
VEEGGLGLRSRLPSTLFSLSSIVSRVAAETTTVGEYTVEKGTVVQADVITLHRNKQIWGQDADEFRPERWTEEGFTQPNAYYAFGGGPRICIGMRLAMVEVKTALVHLLKRFRLSKCPKTEASDLMGRVNGIIEYTMICSFGILGTAEFHGASCDEPDKPSP